MGDPLAERMLDGGALVRSCPEPMVALDTGGFVRVWNHAAEQRFGWLEAEVLGGQLPNVPASEWPRFRRTLGLVLAGEPVRGAPTRRAHRDGTLLDLVMSSAPVEDEDGLVVGVLDLYVDPPRPSDSAQAARAAGERAERRLVQVLESVSDAVYSTDADWRFTFINRRAESLWRRTRDELLGRVVWDEFPTAVGTPAYEAQLTAAREQEPVAFESVSPVISRWVEGTAYPRPEGGVTVFFRDISERKQAEDRLRLLSRTGQELAASLDSDTLLRGAANLAVPVFADLCIVDVVDERGGVRRLEATAADDIDQELVRELLRHPPLATHAGGVPQVLRGGEPLLVPAVGPRHLDRIAHSPEHRELLERFGARSAISVPMTARGRRVGALTFLILRDGRERYDEEDLGFAQELAGRAALAVDNARLYEAAQDASRAKTNFLNVMSHELRTPLTAVIGYVDLLQAQLAGPLQAKQAEYIARIKTAATIQLGIIEEVLIFSRLHSGRSRLELHDIDVGGLLEEAAALLRPGAAVKGLDFLLDLPDDPVVIRSDAGKLRQVLLNLIANAIKFTTHGEVRVGACRQDDGVIIEVRDTGVGIRPEHLDRIFEPFWQVEQATTRNFGGAGLGLAIVRRLARLLGGDVEVASRRGSGSVFRVRLPAVLSPTTTLEPDFPHI